jgi:hypothetical protein
MSLRGVATTVATAMLTAAIMLAAPVSASPVSPCGATLIPICAFVPVLPGLAHDVNLTTEPDPNTQTPNDTQSQVPAIDGR